MANIIVEVPDFIHLRLKRKKLNSEEQGQKLNLKDLYVELIYKVFAEDPTLKTLSKGKSL
jgi:hypothetical protein